MADALTNTAENRAVDFIMGLTTTAPTTPLRVALVTTNGDDATAGTEVTGGTYARQTLSVAAATGGTTSNSADLVWAGLPAVTVVGVEIWDSATTPARLWYGAFADPRTVGAGDDLRLPAGSLTVAIA
ncbi:phage tail fiber protein [Streptomyces sp. NRRL F-5630]|uniref:phage tail fiber protein n=1 Tax=Streptomyces sp. NRRL F-5630 TaxID=1463864 RepID=UPI003D74D1B9